MSHAYWLQIFQALNKLEEDKVNKYIFVRVEKHIFETFEAAFFTWLEE